MADSHRHKTEQKTKTISMEELDERRRQFEESFKDPRDYHDRRHDGRSSDAPTSGGRRKYRRRATFDRYSENWWLKRRYSGHLRV